MMTDKPPLTLLVAAERYGAPVYVRHEIVHNKYVVDSLRDKGAVFVQDLDEVPDGVPVVFSAHGVPKAVPAKAEERGLSYLDATCPLVSKVHRQAERLIGRGLHILFVGHAGHPEVIGTFGQVPEGQMTLVETAEDAETIIPEDPESLAFLTQTTLSVDDTAEIIAILRRRFPSILAPRGEDICYATSNRQAAVKAIAARCDAMLVIGSPNSSNTLRLVEVSEREGTRARLIGRGAEMDFDWLEGVRVLGITAGASAPELLVREVVDCLRTRFDVTEQPVEGVEENMVFKLPAGLQAA
jgi:4-hydroxy-3-methylbut-2-enyl diphosphate reductase